MQRFVYPYPVIFLLLTVFLSACRDDDEARFKLPEDIDLTDAYYVHVDLNDRTNDTFKVTVLLDQLSADQDLFQFAATIPGTYNISDVGRFVINLRAYDENDKLLQTNHISTNQWQFENPVDVRKITYQIAETFDTVVNENPIYAMGGTSIEEDHVLINPPIVFGYVVGLKEWDYYFSADYPANWSIGTALEQSSVDVYHAQNFDYFADSPLLFAELTHASTNIGNTEIDVHVYSIRGNISADLVLDDIEQVMLDAEAFLGQLPVNHYDFLFHFGNTHAGALEHSYSSLYVLQDLPFSSSYSSLVKSISAHEFFHIVTPLNIHSEIIGDFNFALPTPSQHLWLYEGVTEWASDFMQFRNKSLSTEELLAQLSSKLARNENYNSAYSLTDISSQSYTTDGGLQFGNIYNRGAVIACLLDIRLLELSKGTKGLQTLINDLIALYGPGKAFPEELFFNIIVELTYPEVEDFITNYIKGAQPLPTQEYFSKVGINYDQEQNHSFIVMNELTEEQSLLFDVWNGKH